MLDSEDACNAIMGMQAVFGVWVFGCFVFLTQQTQQTQ
jgi:hypothetical protein